MKTIRRWMRVHAAIGAGVVLGGLYSQGAAAHNGQDDGHPHDAVKHVLLISFDGLHEQDVARCINSNACPNLALLAKAGTTYTNAYTPGLSDSFPGLAAWVTGGSPKTAGVFYDVS